MHYLCLAFSVLWSVNFVYLVFLDRQNKNLKKRVEARLEIIKSQQDL